MVSYLSEVPLFVLLTHLDEYHPDIQNNVTKIYHNVLLEHLVNRVTTQVHLPTKRIFPVINYQEAVELDDNTDILLLHALRDMLGAAEEYLKKLAAEKLNWKMAQKP